MPDLIFRVFQPKPGTLDAKNRTVDAVLATDTPVPMPDFERWEMIPERLCMDGCKMASESIPLLDSHQTRGIGNILGSVRDMATKAGKLHGTLHFANDMDGEKAMKKVMDGHLRDLSIGYKINARTHVPEKETQTIMGMECKGPMNVVTDWEVYEGTLTAIGADPEAKIREARVNGTHGAKGAGTKLPEGGRQVEPEKREPQTVTPQPPASPAPVSSPPDPKATQEAEARAKAEGAKQEAERQKEIRAMCQIPGCEDLAEALCNDSTITVEAARGKIIEKMRATRPPVGHRIEAVREERDKFRTAAMDALAMRAGVIVVTPAAGAQEIRGMTLLRLAEECLFRAGLPHRFADPSELIRRAMTTSDFTGILATTANKVLQKEYAEAEETWGIWVEIGEGRDFKDMTRPQLSEAPDLDLVTENGEYVHAAFREFAPSFAIKTYGATANLTRQVVINDDLSAFLRVPRAFGRASQRKIGDLVYNLITTNPSINTTGSSIALFHASHANLMNPALALGVDGLSEMRRMLRVQTGRNSKTLGLKLSYLLVPAILETSAELLVFSPTYPEKGAGPMTNPVAKWGVRPVPEHRLDANSTTAFYGATNPNDCPTIEVAFLNGVRNPTIVEFEGQNPDVKKLLCRIDVGAGLKDHRGLVKSAGA